MTLKLTTDKEAISDAVNKATATRDILMLVKQYARAGYKQTEGGTTEEFEAFWRAAFHVGES